jgi:succinyl-CoA synthetase beta subunit
MSFGSAAIDRMRDRGIPVFTTIEAAMVAIGHAVSLAHEPGRDPVSGDELAMAPRAGYWGAREALAERGIDFPVGRLITSRTDAAGLGAQLRFPVVLKAGWLAHKSEVEGVALGLGSLTELLSAYDEMHARRGPGEYVVEEQDQRPHGVEILVGVRRDPDFGPLVTVGAGGTEAELHRDVTTELAPVDHATALRMIRRLRCLPLLEGWRGRPGVDVDALAAMVASVSHVVSPDSDVDDVEINPVRVTPAGAVALDALIVSSHDVSGTDLISSRSMP